MDYANEAEGILLSLDRRANEEALRDIAEVIRSLGSRFNDIEDRICNLEAEIAKLRK